MAHHDTGNYWLDLSTRKHRELGMKLPARPVDDFGCCGPDGRGCDHCGRCSCECRSEMRPGIDRELCSDCWEQWKRDQLPEDLDPVEVPFSFEGKRATNRDVKRAFSEHRPLRTANLVSTGARLLSYGYWECAKWEYSTATGGIVCVLRTGRSYSMATAHHRSGIGASPWKWATVESLSGRPEMQL